MVEIDFHSWDYTCGDGCCYLYGTDILIDGRTLEHVDASGSMPELWLGALLTALGIRDAVYFPDEDDEYLVTIGERTYHTTETREQRFAWLAPMLLDLGVNATITHSSAPD
ncbi:hypothetical protein [Deinococcus soli (ex Cha et al. 2016)]|uniref:Uncharacterized protein n=2 Tax=Deinococcus soli (ex Cha et al. 2016) TaxID=1309411 RepID=A0AAE4BM30_9DEIO|nr:hypothetical protein [Deinococcus soli (ex Cha et al. 2016)]MDR6218645.1 hypothetical protein [Deinococcus soli (ex Cha et al. 2016)]MDR6328442.1 hypothetical protein [Deinococcus soli (ex Cha et al. 2016)]MDR6753053.1 hypothetical protein [Deinococcus soli (ex Cha et al. 2016)]